MHIRCNKLATISIRQNAYCKTMLTGILCLALLCPSIPMLARQQMDVSQLEKGLNKLEGATKLHRLNLLAKLYYDEGNSSKALKYAREAVEEGEQLFNMSERDSFTDPGMVSMNTAYNHYGRILYDRGKYEESRDQFLNARKISESFRYAQGSILTDQYLAKIDSVGDAGESKNSFLARIGKFVKASGSSATIALELERAGNKERNGLNDEAIGHYEKAIEHLEKLGKQDRVAELETKIKTLRSIQSLEESNVLAINEDEDQDSPTYNAGESQR